MLRWASGREHTHVVRVSSPLRSAIMDTGQSLPRDDALRMPPAIPSATDATSGPSASVASLVAHRLSRGQHYTNAGPALIACSNPVKSKDTSTLDMRLENIISMRADHSFFLTGHSRYHVAFQLLCRLTKNHAYAIAAIRLLNVFAGGPFHITINTKNYATQWTILPTARLPTATPIAVLEESMPVEMRQRIGIAGAPREGIESYKFIHDDLVAVGFDERNERTLWQAIDSVRHLRNGDRAAAARAIGIPPSALGANIDVEAMAHFIYRRTAEWLLAHINAYSTPPAPSSDQNTLHIVCMPEPGDPGTMPHDTLDALWANWVYDAAVSSFFHWWTMAEQDDFGRESLTCPYNPGAGADTANIALDYLRETVLSRLTCASASSTAVSTLGNTFSVQHSTCRRQYDTATLYTADRDESSGIFMGIIQLSAYLSNIFVGTAKPFAVMDGEISLSPSKSPRGPRRARANSAVMTQSEMISPRGGARRVSTPPSMLTGALAHRIHEFDQMMATTTRPRQTWVFCPAAPQDIDTSMLMSALMMRDQNYGMRTTRADFCSRYSVLAHTDRRVMTAELIVSLVGLSEDDCLLGTKRVFLTQSAAQVLNERTSDRREDAAIHIQKWWRGRVVRERFLTVVAWFTLIQACIRRHLAKKKLARLRSEAILTCNSRRNNMVSNSEMDALRRQRDQYQQQASLIAERAEFLLSIIKNAFGVEYTLEEAMWNSLHRMGEFQPYSVITDLLERCMTREAVYARRCTKDISYGAVVALRVIRYAGTTPAACNHLCAAASRLRTQGPAMVACETIAYLLAIEGQDCPKGEELMRAFMRCMKTVVTCSMSRMEHHFRSMIVSVTDRVVYLRVMDLVRSMAESIQPPWLRMFLVEAVCAHLDRAGLDAVLSSRTLHIGAQWAIHTLMALEALAREAFVGLADDEPADSSMVFPWLHQAMKACQMGNKNILLNEEFRRSVCPNIPDECLSRLFVLYQTDETVGEMLPHNLHERILPRGGSSGEMPDAMRIIDPEELDDVLRTAGITADALVLERSQRLPDAIISAMSK